MDDEFKPIKVSMRKACRKGINLKSMQNLINTTKSNLGKCCICGYSKCKKALHFHHQNPKTKSFGIGQYKKANSIEELKSELEKCILVCANCHTELHFPE